MPQDINFINLMVIILNICSIIQAMAYLIQFSYLATIWWLNALCTHIWNTFRSVTQGTRDTGYLRYGWNHPSFKWYAFWSYIMPLFITILTFCMENFFNHYEGTIHILHKHLYSTKLNLIIKFLNKNWSFFPKQKKFFQHYILKNFHVIVGNFLVM